MSVTSYPPRPHFFTLTPVAAFRRNHPRGRLISVWRGGEIVGTLGITACSAPVHAFDADDELILATFPTILEAREAVLKHAPTNFKKRGARG